MAARFSLLSKPSLLAGVAGRLGQWKPTPLLSCPSSKHLISTEDLISNDICSDLSRRRTLVGDAGASKRDAGGARSTNRFRRPAGRRHGASASVSCLE
jgi:hypothetical protein